MSHSKTDSSPGEGEERGGARRLFTVDDAEKVLTYPKTWWAYIFQLWLTKRVSVYLANNTEVTPDQITWASFFCALFAALCFVHGGLALTIVAIIFFQANYLFDCVDGTVARLKGAGTNRGFMLDHVLDRWKIVLVLAGYTIGALRNGEGTRAIWVAYLLLACYSLTFYYNYVKVITFRRLDYSGAGRGVLLQEERATDTAKNRIIRFFEKRKLLPHPNDIDIDMMVFCVFPLFTMRIWGMAFGILCHLVYQSHLLFRAFQVVTGLEKRAKKVDLLKDEFHPVDKINVLRQSRDDAKITELCQRYGIDRDVFARWAVLADEYALEAFKKEDAGG